jgi:hypothetical protein
LEKRGGRGLEARPVGGDGEAGPDAAIDLEFGAQGSGCGAEILRELANLGSRMVAQSGIDEPILVLQMQAERAPEFAAEAKEAKRVGRLRRLDHERQPRRKALDEAMLAMQPCQDVHVVARTLSHASALAPAK